MELGQKHCQPVEEKRFDIGALIVPALFMLQILIVSPFYEFPLNDDWVYSLSVKNLYEKGVFRIIDAMAANCVFHTFWGWISALLFGFSFSALRISTLFLHLLGSLALYGLVREVRFPVTWSLFCVFMVMFNPWIFHLSYSFMTDVPYLSILTMGLVYYYKGVSRRNIGFLWLGSLFSSISFLIREVGILLPVGAFFYLLLEEREFLKKKIFAVIGLPLATFGVFEYWYIFIQGVTEIQVFHRNTMLYNLLSAKVFSQFFDRSFAVLFFLGLVLLPLSVVVLAPLLRRIPDLRPKRRLLLMVVLLFIFGVGIAIYNKGDYFPIDGLWISGSFLGVMQGLKQAVIPNGGVKILFWISILSACVLISWIYVGFTEKDGGGRKNLVFFAVLGLFQFLYLLISPFYFQRYSLPLIPFVILTISLSIKSGSLSRNPLIFLSLIIPALFSVLTTKDSLSWNQCKWSTAQGLVRNGIPLTHVEAGIEWDCWHFYERSREHPEQKAERYYTVPWWLNSFASPIDPIYTLSFSELEGYRLLAKERYHSPLYSAPQEILVLVREPPRVIEDFEDPGKDFTTGWSHNLQANIVKVSENPNFLSEGRKSLGCHFITNSVDTFHYGGVRVKTSMSIPGFIFDLWLLSPRESKRLFVYCYDRHGDFTGKWSRDLVDNPVVKNEKNTFSFLFGLSQDKFQFAGGSGGKTEYVDIFIESDNETASVIFYLDNFRS